MSRYKFKKRKFPKEFSKVAKYIKKKKGVIVTLGHSTQFKGHFTREITIHHNYDLTHNGLYVLLHECGKVYQSPITEDITIYQRFVRDWDAWQMGMEIAEQLEIPINRNEYNLEKERTLLKYFV